MPCMVHTSTPCSLYSHILLGCHPCIGPTFHLSLAYAQLVVQHAMYHPFPSPIPAAQSPSVYHKILDCIQQHELLPFHDIFVRENVPATSYHITPLFFNIEILVYSHCWQSPTLFENSRFQFFSLFYSRIAWQDCERS